MVEMNAIETDKMDEINPRYITGNSDEPKQILQPILGYAHVPLVPLEEACQPLLNIVPCLPTYIWIAKENSKHSSDGLTRDESAAIHLYTMEWDSDDKRTYPSLYTHLNRTLKLIDRTKLRPWFSYLKLFLTALAKLPHKQRQIVWRGVKKNVSDDYPPGTEITWWAFSSCTASLNVLDSDLYLGKEGMRTIFSIEAINARSIRSHSHFQTEDEILLLPGSYFEIKSRLNPAPGLYIIHLQQKIPPHVLLEPPFQGAELLPPSETDESSVSNIFILCRLNSTVDL